MKQHGEELKPHYPNEADHKKHSNGFHGEILIVHRDHAGTFGIRHIEVDIDEFSIEFPRYSKLRKTQFKKYFITFVIVVYKISSLYQTFYQILTI